MSTSPPPALLLGRLADERRLRVLAAVVLGERTVAGVAARAELTEDQAVRALAHLVGLGLVRQTESGLSVELQVLATPRARPPRRGGAPRSRARPTSRRRSRAILDRDAGVYRRAVGT